MISRTKIGIHQNNLQKGEKKKKRVSPTFITWKYTDGRKEGIFSIVRVEVGHVMTEFEDQLGVFLRLASRLHIGHGQWNAIG